MTVLEYQTPAGRKPFSEWLNALSDRQAAAAIANRVNRFRLGLLGDRKNIGKGLWEARIFAGPGYRLYFLMDGASLLILLTGGVKDSQWRDIRKARKHAADYWRRR